MHWFKKGFLVIAALGTVDLIGAATPVALVQEARADVQSDLSAIAQALKNNPAPAMMKAPFTEADARAWVAQAADAKEAGQKAMAKLEQIGPTITDVPTKNTANRLYRAASANISGVDDALGQTLTTLKSELYDHPAVKSQLDWFASRDPTNINHAANVFLHPENSARNLKWLEDRLAIVRSAVNFNAAFGRPPSEKLGALLEETKAIRTRFLNGVEIATSNLALPKPKSEDAALIEIAKAILAKPKYGFDEHGPIILTTKDVTSHTKVVNRDTIKDVDVSLGGDVTFTGERETWTYKWDEFRFATPIKDDGETWHIYWITAKKFESGWAKTPIGEWVSGKVVKGVAIPEEKFR